jgi:hypothetical protein
MFSAFRTPTRVSSRTRSWLGLLALPLLADCTLHHSKQALYASAPSEPPASPEARFVSEEDSGLSVFGMFVLAEPDHYAVLLERMRRDHRCSRLLYPQLDFYTDHWLLIAFPISRITSLCEPEPGGARGRAIVALPRAPGWHDEPAPGGPAPQSGGAAPARPGAPGLSPAVPAGSLPPSDEAAPPRAPAPPP